MTWNQGYSYRHVLGPQSVGHSTLSYLTQLFSHSTECEWHERLQAGEVFVDGKLAQAFDLLKPGKILLWNRPSWLEEDTPQTYGVVYQDNFLLAIDKPSGLPTLPGAGFYRNTLLNLVRSDYPAARPVHRLGRATSGLVLFALDSQTASLLGKQWPKVRKQYQALGSRVATQDVYDVQCPIGEHDHPRLGKVFAASVAGKKARSIARTLQRRLDSTVFEVDLHTGRPHQIRIHLAYIGHPLVGDPLFAAGGTPRTDQPGLPGDAGYWLHAKRLTFEHPLSGTCLELVSPLPGILQID